MVRTRERIECHGIEAPVELSVTHRWTSAKYLAVVIFGLASVAIGAWGMRSISIRGVSEWWTVMPGIAGLVATWWIVASASALSRWAAILLMGVFGVFFYGLAGYSYYQLQRRGVSWGPDDYLLVGTAALCGLALFLLVVVSVHVRAVAQLVIMALLSGASAALVSVLALSAWFDFNPYRGDRLGYPLATLIGAAAIFVAAFTLSAVRLSLALAARKGEEGPGPSSAVPVGDS